MELHLTPELEADLSTMARDEGKTPEQVVLDAARSAVKDVRVHREILEQRIAQADRGEFLEDGELDRRLQALLRP